MSDETVSKTTGPSPTSKPLRVLLVEDQPADAQLVHDLLGESEGVPISIDHVTRLDAAMASVAEGKFDLVLLDLSLPDGYGSFTIDAAAEFSKQLPVVILTGIEDETLALKAINAGAVDYICKSMLDEVHLARTIECAVERQRRLDTLAGAVPDTQERNEAGGLYDPVTGLMTQTLFKDRLEHTLACSERNQEAFAVLALRLNEISKIESDDTTTTLMCSAATCLSRRVRKRDSLARLSRDSFGVVIQGLSNLAAVNSTLGSLVMSLSDVSLPESLALAEGTMSTSVGVSLHPENGFDTAALMNRALQFEFATARIGSPTAQPGA